VWPVTALVIAGAVWYTIRHHYWGLLTLVVLFVFAILALTYVTQVRTKCLVPFTATGHPCQNPTRGIIFGCNGQNHKWDKALATMGIHRQRVGPHPARGRAQESGHARLWAAGEVVTVRIEGSGKNTIMFYTTGLASILTIVVGVDQLRHYL
jgi:hypothetical protein